MSIIAAEARTSMSDTTYAVAGRQVRCWPGLGWRQPQERHKHMQKKT